MFKKQSDNCVMSQEMSSLKNLVSAEGSAYSLAIGSLIYRGFSLKRFRPFSTLARISAIDIDKEISRF
jgi:hypothetical protein